MRKTCKQCGTSFEITDDDLAFYDKLSPVFGGKKHAVPPPARCADCRLQRKLAWRNERFMYRRQCDFSGKEIVSMYPPDSPFKVYEQGVWWSDKWDALEYGRDFDFNRPFFEQFRELQLAVPRVALVNKQSENAHYTNHSGQNKNCYLSSVTFGCEDIYYSDWIIDHCKDLVDCSYMLEGCERCYETYYGWGSYQCSFCDFVKRCQDCWFCFDCTNCRDCFLCWNLRNTQYCIENEQLSKETYERQLRDLLPFDYAKMREYGDRYIDFKATRAIHPETYQVQTETSTGDLLFSTKQCNECYDAITAEDCRYCVDVIDVKNCMDIYHVGWAELMYECHAISNGYHCLFCHFTYDNKNAILCDCTQNSSNLFGCAGLNQSSYCILNKQCSKTEYEALVPKMITHMQHTGEWGEFFPLAFSPFGYNQSRAPEYYPLTEEQAMARGIPWSTYQPPPPDAKRTIAATRLPGRITEIPDDVLNWAILCEITEQPFKIIRQEYDFYRSRGIPLPRCHPNQRYLNRMAQRPPRKLWQRQCAKCRKDIQTTYAPERPETVHCEECYLSTVC